jgi:hypothetical protein
MGRDLVEFNTMMLYHNLNPFGKTSLVVHPWL